MRQLHRRARGGGIAALLAAGAPRLQPDTAKAVPASSANLIM